VACLCQKAASSMRRNRHSNRSREGGREWVRKAVPIAVNCRRIHFNYPLPVPEVDNRRTGQLEGTTILMVQYVKYHCSHVRCTWYVPPIFSLSGPDAPVTLSRRSLSVPQCTRGNNLLNDIITRDGIVQR
jgi:hypothetical protein